MGSNTLPHPTPPPLAEEKNTHLNLPPKTTSRDPIKNLYKMDEQLTHNNVLYREGIYSSSTHTHSLSQNITQQTKAEMRGMENQHPSKSILQD